ncbi:MAG: hypothetical protein K0U98_27090 [Deltaproteobacteria bacterium]|nr:hypothetical protein [Deltaproteobacteria bacterium]
MPPIAVPAPPPPIPPWLAAPPAGFVWSFSTWKPGKTTYNIFWAQTDPAGNRVNLAIVSEAVPAGLWYVAPGLPAGRPAIGVAEAGTNIFSIHALSGGGGDAPGLVTNIAAAIGAGPWDAAGDYNREPPSWVPPAGNLCPPDKPTRWKSKKKLDYMVRSGAAFTCIVIDSLVLSDHFPVVFDI